FLLQFFAKMDSPPSSLTRSLSVVVAREDDSMSSEGYSPRSRDEDYGPFYEKRRRTGIEVGAKRRGASGAEAALEQRLLALSQENERLKSRLESRTAMDSLLSGPLRNHHVMPDMPAMPAASATAGGVQALYGAPTSVITSRYGPVMGAAGPSCSTSAAAAAAAANSAANLPMLQLAQLQAAIQQQLQLPSRPLMPSTSSSSSSLLLSSSSAFQPFSVIKRSPERQSDRPMAPDSSTNDYPVLRTLGHCTDSAPSGAGPSSSRAGAAPAAASGGLLSAILSAPPRTSPHVPRSATEHWSGLASPPREHACSSSSKSDNESAASSSSLSPSGSGSSHGEGGRSGDPKRQAYMDRRRRNNEAAKRCRANRRAVFEFRSNRVQVLETENDSLRDEIVTLRREIDAYKCRLVERGIAAPASTGALVAPPSVISRAPG
ncbi:hypothetical protein PFISCL1PPCAC_8228, partial [Pristionchus fissidentatus]